MSSHRMPGALTLCSTRNALVPPTHGHGPARCRRPLAAVCASSHDLGMAPRAQRLLIFRSSSGCCFVVPWAPLGF
eukprot:6696247-Prymnesium_polylepis.2